MRREKVKEIKGGKKDEQQRKNYNRPKTPRA